MSLISSPKLSREDSETSPLPIWIRNFNCIAPKPCLGNCVSCPSNSSEECAVSNHFFFVDCCKLNYFARMFPPVSLIDSPQPYTETTNETCINAKFIQGIGTC